MPNIENHANGSFCWIELATSDQSASKQFYGPLFGWESAEFPMGPEGVYVIFRIEGRDVAGCYAIDANMQSHGVPPHWMPYVQVANADETVAKATSNGGSVIAGPMDVFNMGRMAVLQDPTGAHFSIWQPMSHKGTLITGVPGTHCWADLSTSDADRAQDFYQKVFGWEIAAGEHDSSGYLHIKNGQDFIGGIPPAKYRNPNAPPHWMLYFLVASCDASAAKAKELGAKFHMEPSTMENVGRMAVFADPQGAVSALFEPMRRG
jgi:predicted enzyme related to lactoylglutathione lyase